VQAIEKTIESGNPTALAKREARRLVWRWLGRFLGKITR
jgi:hypothetical protein